MNTYTFFKCVADNNRRKILEILGKSEKHVGEIVEKTGLEQSLVSHHLKVLRECGLVKSKHEGKRIIYSLSTPEIYDILRAAQEIASKIGEVKPHRECQ